MEQNVNSKHRTKRKPRELFTEYTAQTEMEAARRSRNDQWHDWFALISKAHCRSCHVLLLVPYDSERERYRFDEQSWAHELGCPDS